MHKRNHSPELKNMSENFNSFPFQIPSSSLMQLTQNENSSNETNHCISHLRRKRNKRNNQLPLRKLKELKANQLLTNSKLDFITNILLSQFPSYNPIEKTILKKSSFCFSFSNLMNQKYYDNQFKPTRECEQEIFDYFSFNIKPEPSFVSEGESKDKFIQPDKLIAFKFLEDTEVFSKNNISTNNFNRLTSNPFTQSTNKSDGELKTGSTNLNINKPKLPNKSGSNKENNDLIHNFSLMKDDISLSLVNYYDEKKENRKERNVQELKENIKDNQGDGTTNSNLAISQNTSQSDIASSIQSGSNNGMVAKSSQDRFRKVRGFNFKNNIKTKKFSKGIMINSEEKASHGIKYLDIKKLNVKNEDKNIIKETNENVYNDQSNKKKPKDKE